MFSEASVKIIKGLKNIFCKEGDYAVFECVLSSDNVRVTWLKDGVELTPEDDYEFESEKKRHLLIVPEAAPDHHGEYTIIVGEKSSSALLEVEGKSFNRSHSFNLPRNDLINESTFIKLSFEN